ncbi:MAG TPA: TonB-dependent receptor plug domain-containing protein [Phenylobacterium sp.]|nr:TonB-dependent receptor plug domain-containing protein [Phenylobacterium sp.]
MVLLLVLAQAAAPAAVAAAPAPRPQGVISYPAAYFAAANTSNALDMVNRLPDFTLNTGDAVRGFEGAAGNVLIDGPRPAAKSDPLDSILQRIPISNVERIDVIRGGAPGIDMQGQTVIANVIRKKDSNVRGLVAVGNQHINDGRNLAGVRMEASGGLPGGRSWEFATHPGAGPDDGEGPGHNTIRFADGSAPFLATLRAKGTDVQGVATAAFETPLAGGRLRINGRINQDKFREPETDFITSPGPDLEHFGFVQKNADTEAGGRFTRDFASSTNLEIVALRNTHHRSTDSNTFDADPSVTGNDASSDFFNDRHSTEAILRGVVKQRLGAKLSLEAGTEEADNTLDSRTRFIENRVGQFVPAANVQVEEKRNESFLKLAWNPISTLNIDAALHYESSDISSKGDVVLAKSLQFAKPRLAIAWTPVHATQLRFRVEKVVGQLNFDDFVASSNLTNSVGVTAGNPNLNPEQDWVVEGEVEQQLWTGSSVVLTARHFKITDAQDRGPVFAPDGTVFDQPTNIGAGTKDELAAVATLRFDTFGWKGAMLKGDVTRRYSQVTDPTTGQNREISDLLPIDWDLSFSQDLTARHATVGVDLFGGWRRRSYRFNFIETVKIKTYVRPFFEWKPRPDLSVRIEVPLATHPQVRLRDEVLIFNGPRAIGAMPSAVQERTFTFPRSWYIRLLKTFG